MSDSRRPLKTRSTAWAQAVTGTCVRWGLSPNAISVWSVAFALLGGGALFWLGHDAPGPAWLWYLLAAMGIQLRLLCNMLDGMVAQRAQLQSRSGEIYNELPDRVADALILVGAGYAQVSAPWHPLLGWAAALVAVLTAYIRALGVVAGAGQQFCGPMAKPQRMATMTVACLLALVLELAGTRFAIMPWTLGLILLGSIWTCIRRTRRVLDELEST